MTPLLLDTALDTEQWDYAETIRTSWEKRGFSLDLPFAQVAQAA